ncbi:hypothetical protein [Candidatus Clostridium radicumherbarum]|uniref:Uncharacterized protein n=1 Tax=Candidatus Clostridium radicumherbarum TaxID=3381662 RepID=A0ABW8TUC6_9CLOT
MFNVINKYKVSILWTLSITIFIICVIIAQFKPFTNKGSGVIMWFTFNSALLAMLLSALKKGSKFRIIFCISSMAYITYKVILRFI